MEGPGDIVWRFPVELSPSGGFYQAFAADDLPTGTFTAAFELPNEERLAEVTFRMEAYRLPEFEIHLTAPDRAPLDGELKVGLTATYYAGGRVAGRPVRWRVTQFPYAWQPKGQEGFLFSSDARFAGARRFEGSPRLEQEDVTDAEGGASLTLNPGAEATAQPRTYLVEATVTGADDQTVTAVQQVVALPPFVLGLKAPRFLANADDHRAPGARARRRRQAARRAAGDGAAPAPPVALGAAGLATSPRGRPATSPTWWTSRSPRPR